MTLRTRRATLADAPIVIEFNHLLALESEGKTLDLNLLRPGVEAGLADENKALYFLAEAEGQVVGQLMITREWSDWRNGWMWWIQSVYVREAFRRGGVFRSLFQHVHRIAQEDSTVIGLRLYVERDNHRAHATYQRMGLTWTSYLVMERYPL